MQQRRRVDELADDALPPLKGQPLDAKREELQRQQDETEAAAEAKRKELEALQECRNALNKALMTIDGKPAEWAKGQEILDVFNVWDLHQLGYDRT